MLFPKASVRKWMDANQLDVKTVPMTFSTKLVSTEELCLCVSSQNRFYLFLKTVFVSLVETVDEFTC